jgi:uncharacterized protein (DUF486 family)
VQHPQNQSDLFSFVVCVEALCCSFKERRKSSWLVIVQFDADRIQKFEFALQVAANFIGAVVTDSLTLDCGV